MVTLNKLDTNGDLIIQPCKDGIRLIRPTNDIDLSDKAYYSVSDILKLPFNIGFLDTDSVIRDINETTIKTSGFVSVSDAIGKTVRVAAKKDAAEFSLQHDRDVLKTGKTIVTEENFTRLVDDVNFRAITIKTPWRDENNNILGVFFCALTIGAPGSMPLADSFSLMFESGLTKLFNGIYIPESGAKK